MLIKEILKAFARKNVVSELTGQLAQMLRAAHWMFDQACGCLMGRERVENISDALYAKDREINRLEREIRERIVTHLSVGNESDLAPCLALMSLVKDAERIGDYCKNIFEVSKFSRSDFAHKEFSEPLDEIRSEISQLFEPVAQALTDQDSSSAKRIRQRAHDLSSRCDMIVQQLLQVKGDFAADEAVAYVLLARHYKRVEAHLWNLATGVISPIPMLDFEKKR
jgi:phosphate uptake regulator